MDKRIILYMIFLGLSFYIIQTYLAPKTTYQQQLEQKQEKPLTVNKTDDSHPLSNENFYVLENNYQQIVFSNVGGSVAEINLPLKNKENKSIVLPTEIDSKISENYPENDQFPQNSYYLPGFKKVQTTKTGGYYPLLRRSIYNKNKTIAHYLNPQYYGLNIYESENSYSNVTYEVTRFENNLIEFVGELGSKKITKTYSIDESDQTPYIINLKIKITGPTSNLWLSTGILDVELTSNTFIPSLKYRIINGTKYSTDNLKIPKTENIGKSSYIDWMSNSNGFFGVILNPVDETKGQFISQNIPGSKAPSRLTVIDSKYSKYPATKYPGYNLLIPLPQKNEMSFRIYAGPYQDHILKGLDNKFSEPVTGYTPDFISVKSAKGIFSFASEPFAKFLFLIMRLFYIITHSWGFSIILLTIVFRVMLYPLNSWSIKSTMKMQEVTPLLKVIDAKYKKDPKKANMEKMRLFKEKGANPASGCLPLLIQFPFLIGMFSLLKNTFELRGVPFIHGWIDNLTSPDILFSWNYPIFIIGSDFHLLPILIGVIMFIQSKMNLKLPEDRSNLTDQQKQQVIMTWALPLIFTFFFYKAASGLNIYFFFSMLLGIIQQWYMTKKKNTPSLKLIKK